MLTSFDTRLPKIQDALATRFRRYPRADVFPYPFTDYLTILVGEPCIITSFIDSGYEGLSRFSTLPAIWDANTRREILWVSPTGSVSISIRFTSSVNPNNSHHWHREIFDRLFVGEGQEVLRYFGECLTRRANIGSVPYCLSDDIDPLVLETFHRLLDGLRDFCATLERRYLPHELSVGLDASLMSDISIHVVKPGTEKLITLEREGRQDNELLFSKEITAAYLTGLVQWLNDSSGITVPLHVHGAPWIVVCYRPSNSRIWMSCYSFYREFIPELGDALRTWVKATFFDHLTIIMRAAIRPEASKSEMINEMAAKFHILARCLPSPEIRFSSHSRGEEVAVLDCGLAQQIPVWILSRNDHHPKHLPLFDVASSTEVKQFLEAMSRSIAAEEFQRSWTHASFTSHLLGTPIAELRGCLLECKCDSVRKARSILNEMDAYRKALRTAVTRNTRFEFSGNYEQFEAVISSVFPNASIRNANSQPKAIRSSTEYLKIVSGVCLDNARDHGCGKPMEVLIYQKDRELWADLVNSFASERRDIVVEALPDMRQGSTDQLGIQTLHLCCDRWFACAPEFEVTHETDDDTPRFHVKLPIAHYDT